MQVFLETIEFNHNRGSATADAFNIRRNETEVVNVPEWRRGVSVMPEDSPAAYARDELNGRTPTIKAKFSFLDFDPGIQSIKIRALDGHLAAEEKAGGVPQSLELVFKALTDNVLGPVTCRPVEVISGKEFEFHLDKAKINGAGVTVSNIVWRWQFQINPPDWTDFAISNHRIFTVLKMPTCPWQPQSSDDSNTQQPWTEVLEYACRWGAGAQTLDQAASLITRAVNELGPSVLEYDRMQSGGKGYVSKRPPRFDCTDFLNLLRGQNNNNGRLINCDDCAAIVASFCNIVGSELFESSMGAAFDLNFHRLIGLPSGPAAPHFSHHTVAWKGACREDDELFDACLQVDSDSSPSTTPHPLMLPTNIRFGQIGEEAYRFRLVTKEHEGRCMPSPDTTRFRRIIGSSHPKDKVCPPTQFNNVAGNNRTVAGSPPTPSPKLFISGFFLDGTEIPQWKLKNIRFINQTDCPPIIQSFWSPETKPTDAIIRLEIHQGSSLKDARETIVDLHEGFQLPDITKRESPPFGDEVFSVSSNFVILFSRANLVFLLRNVGETFVSTEFAAVAIDNLVKRDPSQFYPTIPAVLFELMETKEANRRLLRPIALDPEGKQRQYKFFTKSGEVSLEDHQLVYRSVLGQPDELEIFAIDILGRAERQGITID